MNKKRILLITVISLVVLVTAIFIYERVQISYNKSASTVSVIGGADGPTSVFIAGKVGGDDTVTYTQITMDEATQIFESDTDGSYIILDVRRADEFAEKLAALGYANIIEFGGIMDWTGEIEK